MFGLIQTTFLKGSALVYFMDVIVYESNTPQEAILMLEKHFWKRNLVELYACKFGKVISDH